MYFFAYTLNGEWRLGIGDPTFVGWFTVFAYLYLGEAMRWNHVTSFGCLFAAVVFAFWGRS